MANYTPIPLRLILSQVNTPDKIEKYLTSSPFTSGNKSSRQDQLLLLFSRFGTIEQAKEWFPVSSAPAKYTALVNASGLKLTKMMDFLLSSAPPGFYPPHVLGKALSEA
jgi:hypothetical protein